VAEATKSAAVIFCVTYCWVGPIGHAQESGRAWPAGIVNWHLACRTATDSLPDRARGLQRLGTGRRSLPGPKRAKENCWPSATVGKVGSRLLSVATNSNRVVGMGPLQRRRPERPLFVLGVFTSAHSYGRLLYRTVSQKTTRHRQEIKRTIKLQFWPRLGAPLPTIVGFLSRPAVAGSCQCHLCRGCLRNHDSGCTVVHGNKG